MTNTLEQKIYNVSKIFTRFAQYDGFTL